MERDEYRRMAAVEETHWWYATTRALLHSLVGPRLHPGGRFLDAGAGTGATGAWMAEHGSLVALDFEPVALELFRELHPGPGLAAGDVAHLPFVDDAFDAALCVTVLCHRSITDPAAVVRELARVVHTGGTVALMEPGVRALRRAHDRVTHTGRRFSRAKLAGLLEQAGCEIVRSTGAYSFLVPPAAVKAVLERGRTSSDLDRAESGLAGVLPRLARLEQRFLRRRSLPFGLSVVAVGRVI